MQVDEVIDMDARLAPLPEAPAALPAVQQAGALAPTRSRDDMLLAAMDRGYTPEQIAQMMDLKDRFDAKEAEKAFNDSFASFKANPVVILKDSHVKYKTDKGVTEYYHATHFAVMTQIAEALAPYGLSHSFQHDQRDGKIKVTCVLKHRAGHSISTSLEASYDASGGKNSIQAIVSAKTYLERHTLLGITGLSTQDLPDDDGAGAGDAGPGPITEKILDGLLADLKVTKTDEAAALLWASGSKVLAATGRPEAYAEFKQAVIAHRRDLKEAGR